MDIGNLYRKYKNIIAYLFFGGCTTSVNVTVYWIVKYFLKLSVMQSVIIAWILAVLFAYLTNRKWVFHSGTIGIKAVTKEALSFFLCRLVTGCVDWFCMFLFVEILGWNDVVIKVFANILVILLNYFTSRLVVFERNTE